MSDTAIVATPILETLTLEIKAYFWASAQNAVEIGKRLILAKAMLQHGQWAEWLDTNFNLKVRMAQNLMAIAKRFGDSTNAHLNAYLNQTQMIELLKLPEGSEESFIDAMKAKGTPVDTLTVKQLRGAIKEFGGNIKSRKSGTIDAKILPPADSDTDVAACLSKLKEFNALAESLSKNPNLKDALQSLIADTDSAGLKITSTNLSTLARPFSRHVKTTAKELKRRSDAELIFLFD